MEVLGTFGLAFEDYILDFLREMFPAIAGLPPRLMINANGANAVGQHFECDAILNDAVEAFVLEVKAAWIRGNSILTQDHDDFVQQLLGKYGIATAGTQGTADRKGVAQLARSAAAIARNEWLGPQRELADARTIYPILVVHDQRLSYPGIGPFLNQAFRRYLGEVPAGRRVADLIILTVADIENLASSVENFGFTQLLKDYASQVPVGRLRSSILCPRRATASSYNPARDCATQPTRLWTLSSVSYFLEKIRDTDDQGASASAGSVGATSSSMTPAVH